MFTGIIQKMGTITENRKGALTLRAEFPSMRLGHSLAVNGVCLTVSKKGKNLLTFDVSPETLRLTNLGDLRPGDTVNLEPPLTAGDFLGGHWVSGHVEACAPILFLRPIENDSVVLRVSLPKKLKPYLVHKGSISVDGISLTITRIGPDFFESVLIPHTLDVTNLGKVGPGYKINLETDMMVKTIHTILKNMRLKK